MTTETSTAVLRRLYDDQTINLSPCVGSRLISQAKNVFRGYIDSDFITWDANEPGASTPKTLVAVYEMAEDATFAEIFASLYHDVESLCLTQDQIIAFCENHPDKLHPDSQKTFFPFKSRDKLFVTDVSVYDREPVVYARCFDEGSTWRAEYHYRVVVPQILRPYFSSI